MTVVMLAWLCGIAILSSSHAIDPKMQSILEEQAHQLKEQADQLSRMGTVVSKLSQQLMMQQLFVEEKIRSDGHSGLKRVRLRAGGTQPYHSESFTGISVASIHDHANLINTAGLGEMNVVLNGIDFRTRHNDYKLVMPHRTLHGGSQDGFHKTEQIPFPEVPPQVLNKKNISEQVEELREWFKAWQSSDHSVRDYRKYFRPVLCYLEGAWMANTEELVESFESDRHSLDASSWFDMLQKIRFTSYAGSKSNQENYAYLPTKIISTVEKHNITVPIYAQWNYRILCHPVKREVPLTLLRPVDDFHVRMAFLRKYQDVLNHRGTRFQINPVDRAFFYDRRFIDGIVDRLMEEIPGNDNYPGKAVDNAFDLVATELRSDEPVNAAYYHRYYRVTARGAMGEQRRKRGFSDENLFAAMTNSSKIAPMTVNDCKGSGRKRVCKTYTQRWTYAIPLELIYLTPLSAWNPYGIAYAEDRRLAKTVTAGGRNGGKTVEKAYNGTALRFYFRTPTEFYEQSADKKEDSADTGAGEMGVLDPSGNLRIVRSSGIYTVLPNIKGIGRLRTRFPIMPVHESGNTAYKEAVALREFMFEETYTNLGRHVKTDGKTDIKKLGLKSQGTHCHEVYVSKYDVAEIMQGKRIMVTSEEANGHSHELKLFYDWWRKVFTYESCDGLIRCKDRHQKRLTVMADDESC